MNKYVNLDLSNNIFKNVDLTNADFSHSNLENAQFIECLLTNAKFNDCVLTNTVFENVINVTTSNFMMAIYEENFPPIGLDKAIINTLLVNPNDSPFCPEITRSLISNL